MKQKPQNLALFTYCQRVKMSNVLSIENPSKGINSGVFCLSVLLSDSDVMIQNSYVIGSSLSEALSVSTQRLLVFTT
jgi:hypothetical protein